MYWFQRWFERITDAVRAESGAIQNSVKEQIGSISEDREAEKHDRAEAAKIIARAIQNASDSPSDYEKTQRNKEYGLQQGVLFLTVITAIGAIVASIVSIITLGQVKKSTDATKTAAYAACKSAEISRQALIETQNGGADTHAAALASVIQAQALRQGQMPLVLPESGTTAQINWGRGVIDLPFTFSNKGKTRASAVSAESYAVLIPEHADANFAYGKDVSIFAEPFMEPGEIATLPSFAGQNPGQPALIVHQQDGTIYHPTRESIEILRKEKWRIVSYSRIRFADYGGIVHRVYFCQENSVAPVEIGPGKVIGISNRCANYNRQTEDGPQFTDMLSASQPKPQTIPAIKCEAPK